MVSNIFGPKSLWMLLSQKPYDTKESLLRSIRDGYAQRFAPCRCAQARATKCVAESTTVLRTLQMKCALRSTVSGNLFQCLAYLFVRATRTWPAVSTCFNQFSSLLLYAFVTLFYLLLSVLYLFFYLPIWADAPPTIDMAVCPKMEDSLKFGTSFFYSKMLS